VPNTPGLADHAAPIEAVVEAVAASTIEPKVTAATAASAGSAAVVLPFVLWLLATYAFHGDVPLPVQGIVGLLVSGAITFAAGYRARHVDRAV
jgi:hypothetical protein